MTEKTSLPNYMTENRGITLKSAKADPNNPGSFTVSEEEAAKLRAMAMANNGSEQSEEMKAAMNMVNGDYDQKIPKNVHNHICYDEARRKNEKYREEAEEFTNSIIQDNATKEILDEAEATTNLSKFDFGDIDEYLTKLEELSFLEAVSYKKKIDAEIARWKSCESMLKAISDLKLDDTTNRELMKINAMENYDFTESIEDFESHYEENLGKLEKIGAKLVEMVNAHKDEMDSTKFLTNEMIHLMSGKLAKLDPNSLNYNLNKAKMETVIDAFSNRLSLDYLSNKLDVYLKTNKNNIKRDFRDNETAINGGRRTKVINDLIRFFNEEIAYSLYERLMYTFDDDVYATYLMLGFIAKIMNTEKNSSRDSWAKVFALNLSDIRNGIFDIGDSKGYMTAIRETFFDKVIDYVYAQKKFGVKLTFGVSFGLKSFPCANIDDIEVTPLPAEDTVETDATAPTEE